jgi:hypothetical protein
VDLSIVIVNWNTRDLLLACLKSVFETVHDLTYEVIVLDNASPDGSAAAVKQAFPQVKLIESQQNLGFAGGNNRALTQAGGATILLLNPDTIVLPNAINALYEALKDYPALGAVGAQLLNADRTEQASWGQFPSLGLELPIVRQQLSRQPALLPLPTGAPPRQILNVDWATGASLMIKRATLEQVGNLDETYWLYTEETDWCFRARRSGWQIGVALDAQIVHVQQAASRQRLANSLIQFARSRALFLRKHRSRLAAQALWLIFAVKGAIFALLPGKSPIGKASADIPHADVKRAYAALAKESLSQLAGRRRQGAY